MKCVCINVIGRELVTFVRQRVKQYVLVLVIMKQICAYECVKSLVRCCFWFYNMEYHVIQLRAEVKELHYQRDLAQNELDKFRERFAQEEKAADKNMVHISILEFANKTTVVYLHAC